MRVAEHPLASVTVAVYVPASTFIGLNPPVPGAIDHSMLYPFQPPEAMIIISPLACPAHAGCVIIGDSTTNGEDGFEIVTGCGNKSVQPFASVTVTV